MNSKIVILKRLFFILISSLALIAATQKSYATHLRAGEIIVERENCQSLTFTITIIVFTDEESEILFGQGNLRFGDNSDPDNDGVKGFIIPQKFATSRPDLGENVGVATFTYKHTYGAPGRYIISYFEQNRNEGIMNMDNSVNTPFFIEAEILVDPFLGCNNSPVMLIPPVDKGCVGVAFYHNPGAYDPDGDSLSYELVVPKKNIGTEVDNYRDPIKDEFYTGTALNEEQNGPPEFSIDPITGLLKWDAPGDAENAFGREYNVTFIIREWRKIEGKWYPMGYVQRDMQIIIEECENDRPELIVPDELCVVAGTQIDEIIRGIDINGDDVKIEAYSQIFFMPSSPATYAPNNGVWQSTEPFPGNAQVVLNWQTDCTHIRDQPYQVVFKITDNPSNGPKLVSFETLNIRVIGPPPEWVSADLNFADKSIDLVWQDYPCGNAEEIQIWRRVDSYSYVPGECETGMPDFLGYELIDRVNPLSTAYSDNNRGRGLNVAVGYCYRLVAKFSLPSGGESILSQEICLDPVEADAPVITHVTVDKTDSQSGEITVSWKKPYDLNTTDFGVDYRYLVQRGVGLVPNTFTDVGVTADTTLTDIGLNTEGEPYSYRIVLYSEDAVVVTPSDPIDTSAVASSVWLAPTTTKTSVTLFWVAQVPWSNISQEYPWHYIYRGLEGESESQLELIDSVMVSVEGFTYVDEGQYNEEPLVEGQTYCYYVTTRGTYGNPWVETPLINKSQMICISPSDDLAPCPPVVTVDAVDCEEFRETVGCDFSEFENVVSWETDFGGSCVNDVQFYDVYVANSSSSEYQYVASTTETFYVDTDLTSFARCYKIKAVDKSGNVSEFSNAICVDNCPYYELPNVFTPGNSDNCNDLFSAYSNRIEIGEDGSTVCGEIDLSKCARFVEKVTFVVYNRWGRPVYEYESGGENTIYIDWDGRDKNGKELSAGTYYYKADVVFDVVNPSKKLRTLKGWIKLIR